MNGRPVSEWLVRTGEVGVRFRSSASGGAGYWGLRRVTLAVHRGECVGIVGRNGAGKSTLLQLLAGIIDPDRGEVCRRPGLRTALLSLQVGFVPSLTGRDNAVLSGMLLGIPRATLVRQLDEIAEFSGLGEFFDQPVGVYSAGMRARLGFSVAFRADPDLLLIDEVIGVGDQQFRNQAFSLLREKVRDARGVVLVSHNLPTLGELCDRIVWIEQGEVRMEGATEEVLRHYRLWMKGDRLSGEAGERPREAGAGP